MAYPIISAVFDEKKVATKTKTGLVQIRIYHNHKRKFISTGIKVYAEQWNDKTFVKGRGDALSLNDQINDMLAKVRECANECIRQSGDFSFEKFSELYDKPSKASASFLDFMFERMYAKGNRATTTVVHEVVYRKLEKSGLIRSFSDINRVNFAKFEEYMKKDGIKQSTLAVQLAIVKTYVAEAYRFGLIDNDPIANYKLDRGKSSTRKYLTIEELKKLASVELEGVYEVARDFFLFMCYTALSYSDAVKFNFERDVFQKDGQFMFRDTRQKTNEEYCVVLIPQAMEILQKYNYSFPKFFNGRVNYLLNVVGIKAGLTKKVTCHMARHTAACLALNNGVRIEVVSKMLGHANINTTQIYAKMLSKEVEKAYDVVASVWDKI